MKAQQKDAIYINNKANFPNHEVTTSEVRKLIKPPTIRKNVEIITEDVKRQHL